MTGLLFPDRAALLRLAVDRGWRSAVTAMRRLPMPRRRPSSPFADQLLFLPQDLRTADPGLAEELAEGELGLAGAVVDVAAGSPFSVRPPSSAWEKELHGFGWLRDLEAAQTEEARKLACELAHDWVCRHRQPKGVAWEPAVTARRIISWLGHASLILDDNDPRCYADISDSLDLQIVHLSAAWRQSPDGLPRLLSLIALVLCKLCVAGNDRALPRLERALAAELDRQILADGGHLSRSPLLLIELMLELLPLRQCFAARRRPLPAAIERAMTNMLEMLHLLRLGDGSVARFNGMGPTPADAMATIFAYDEAPPPPSRLAPQSRYARLACGPTTLVADVGSPPGIGHAGQAHAGCLSFELSSGMHPLIVNCGGVPASNLAWHTASRSTASHSTLCLKERSSATLVRTPLLEQELGTAAIRFPRVVTATLESRDGGAELIASHDGYLESFGLIHRRRITVAADGGEVDGCDELGPPRGVLRLKHDLPYAVHFHLDPAVSVRAGEAPAMAELGLPGAPGWRISGEGAALSIEEGLNFASPGGPRASRQVVLRGRCAGEARVTWRLERRR